MSGRNSLGRRSNTLSQPRWVAVRRAQVCEETARIMVEQGTRDFQLAKTKAVERLGPGNRFPLPTNKEIEQALDQRLRLFDADKLNTYREILLHAAGAIMRLLGDFKPRLVGTVLRGTITERTPIELHVFADTVEDVYFKLGENNIDATSFEKRVRYARKRYLNVPGFWFNSKEVRCEVLVFPYKGIREAPLCPITARPMERIPLSRVFNLSGGTEK